MGVILPLKGARARMLTCFISAALLLSTVGSTASAIEEVEHDSDDDDDSWRRTEGDGREKRESNRRQDNGRFFEVEKDASDGI